MIEFDVKIKAGDLYDYMLRHTYNSFSGMLGSGLGALMVIAGIYLEGWLMVIAGVVLLCYLPWTLFLKSRQQMLSNPAFKETLHYVLDEEGIHVSQNDTEEMQRWEDMVKAVSTGRSIIVYTSRMNACIFPKRELGDETAQVIQIISTHMERAESKTEILETFGEEETYRLGEKLGQGAQSGQVYTLIGGLGVGKTVFTKGFARGLGITEHVSSPTFTILQVYESGRLPFYHFDVYRIGDVEEMEEIGYEDCFFGGGVCLIEWADLIKEILPAKHTQITIRKDLEKGFDYRMITVKQLDAAE